MSHTPDPLDEIVNDALRLRPMPAPIDGLEGRAIALARREEAADAARKARLLSLHRWSAALEWMAAGLVALVLLLAPAATSSDSTSGEGRYSIQNVVAAEDDGSAISAAVDPQLLSKLAMLGALMYLAISNVWTPRPSLRFNPR